ncbi:MAG: hypothetical protein QOK05_701 [Chloroflexota bacterium]|jgi:hypothetical protein|nr:hypothetical protein [Chloroflexota bacterium]
MEALVAGVSGLAAEDLGGRGVALLAEDLRELRQVVDRIEAEAVRRLARFDGLDGPKSVGTANAISFLQFLGGLDVRGAVERAQLAESRETLPFLTEAAVSGRVSFDQAAIIARGASEVRAEHAPQVEARALELALGGTYPSRLRHMTKAIVAEIDSNVLDRDENWAHNRRSLRIGHDRDGSVHVEGLLESECAAYLRAVTDALMGQKGKDDDRTGPQRRHDALLDALKGGLGGRPGRPHITVVAPLSAMLGEDGPPALLQGLVPISAEHLRRLAAEGTLSATLVDANGREVYSGTARRFSTPKRRSMAARTGTCEWPGGCDRPAEWCDGHHVDPFAQGGLTAADRGELQCGFHHRLIDPGGWAVVVGTDGVRRAVPPGHPENPMTSVVAFADEAARARDRRTGTGPGVSAGGGQSHAPPRSSG